MTVGALALVGCRPDTVTLGFAPEVGDTYRYRYDIDLVLTRTVEGGPPDVTELRSTLTSAQEVLGIGPEGVLVEVALRSEASAPTTAVVLLDRAGSLQAIEEVEGLPAEAAGLSPVATVLASGATEPPERPLSPGDRWTIAGDDVLGEGRLVRLGVVDGQEVAVLTTSLVQAVDDAVVAGNSAVALEGELRSSTSTTFDLIDGAVREGSTTATGRVDLEVSPPPGTAGPAVPAAITYELRIRTVRLG